MKRTVLWTLLAFAACKKADEPPSRQTLAANAIAGKWALVSETIGDTLQPLTSCLAMTAFVFDWNGGVSYVHAWTDSNGNCFPEKDTHLYWYYAGSLEDTGYTIRSRGGSIIDQNARLRLDRDTLCYSYDAWDLDLDRTPAVITTPVRQFFRKSR